MIINVNDLIQRIDRYRKGKLKKWNTEISEGTVVREFG